MQIGDVVQIIEWNGSRPDERKHGTVVRLQGSHRWSGKKRLSKKDEEILTEVLWQNGFVGWILSSRLGRLTTP